MRDTGKKIKRNPQSSVTDIRMNPFNELENKIDECLGIVEQEAESISEKMALVDEWNWDVFGFCRDTTDRAFPILGLKLFLEHKIFSQLQYDY
jgi:hypothetical protein